MIFIQDLYLFFIRGLMDGKGFFLTHYLYEWKLRRSSKCFLSEWRWSRLPSLFKTFLKIHTRLTVTLNNHRLSKLAISHLRFSHTIKVPIEFSQNFINENTENEIHLPWVYYAFVSYGAFLGRLVFYTIFSIRATLYIKNNEAQIGPKLRTKSKNKLRLRLKKVKMSLVETLLNLVIYVGNVQSKNTEAPFPIYYYICYCPKLYTYLWILKVPRTISFNCCTCMFQRYCTRMNEEKFQSKLLTEIRTN